MFLTYHTITAQGEEADLCYTLHNQLFKDTDGTIYLVPRYFETDGYTIPYWLAWIGGGKKKWDMRPAIGHDLECKYHQAIVVNLTEEELRSRGYLYHKEKTIGDKVLIIPVCEDIPIKYLTVKKSTFNQANSRFKRMMKATGQLKAWRVNMMRLAVNFNVGWAFSGKTKINLENLYKSVI